MNRRLLILCTSCYAFTATLAGCGAGGDFATAPTSGRVLCEGQPVPFVTVIFEPLATGQTALAGKQGIGRANQDGIFTISTYGKEDGAVIGKHRVRVAAPNREVVPDFSCDCVVNSEIDVMQVEVQKGQQNAFDVVLQKKTGKERPSFDDLEDEED